MKKIIFLTAFAIGIFANAIAQTEAKIGEEYTYTISSTPVADSYGWNLSGGTNALATVNAATTQAVTFTWDNAVAGNTYNMTVYGILGGCEGDNFTKQYRAVAEYSYTASWAASYNTCPATVKNPAGGTDAAFDLQMTINSGAAITIADQVRVSFMVEGVPQPAVTVNPNASGVVKIPVTFADATNTTGAAIVNDVVITAVQIIGRDAVSYGNNDRPAGQVSILPVPVINDIF